METTPSAGAACEGFTLMSTQAMPSAASRACAAGTQLMDVPISTASRRSPPKSPSQSMLSSCTASNSTSSYFFRAASRAIPSSVCRAQREFR